MVIRFAALAATAARRSLLAVLRDPGVQTAAAALAMLGGAPMAAFPRETITPAA
jgi:hypothetical protein